MEQFLLEDYKLKVSFLSNQYNGMWTRFNFFVTIQTALIGGKFIFGGGPPGPAVAVIGFVLSLIWYALGAQDSYLARLYQKQIELAAHTLWARSGMQDLIQDYPPVGFSQDKRTDIYADVKNKAWYEGLFYRIARWRWEPISVSKLIALVPFGVCLAWAGVLIFQYA